MDNKRFNALRALCGLSVIAVFLSNSMKFIPYAGDWGVVGIEFFFVLSGFFCSHSIGYDNMDKGSLFRDCLANLWRMVKRVWPLYAAFLIVSAILQWIDTGKFVLHLLMVQSYLGSAPVALSYNLPAWIISSAAVCFLFAPLFSRALRKITKKMECRFIIVLMAIICAVQIGWAYLFRAYTNTFDTGFYFVYVFPIARMADFVQGMLLACIVKKCEQKESKPIWTLLELLSAVLIVVENILFQRIPKTFRYASAWVVPVCLISGLFALEKGKISVITAKCRPLIFVGGISFELYIMHRPILNLVSRYTTSVFAWILCSGSVLLLAFFMSKFRQGILNEWNLIKTTTPDQLSRIASGNRSRVVVALEKKLVKLRSQKFLFEELVKRDFKQKYKRTVLGMGWSILFPLLQLIVMRLVFTRFFGRNMPYYTTYLFAGNLMFNYFKESTSGSMTALRSNASIFTKINVPKYLFLLSKNVSAVINFGLALIVFFVFAAIDGITFTPVCFAILYPIACLTLFNIGVGMILSALHVFFRDIQYLYEIFTLLLLYMSAIFYYVDSYPENVQKLFLLNPVYANIKYVRLAVIEATVPSLAYHGLLLLYAVVALGIGALIYKKKNQKFLYYV